MLGCPGCAMAEFGTRLCQPCVLWQIIVFFFKSWFLHLYDKDNSQWHLLVGYCEDSNSLCKVPGPGIRSIPGPFLFTNYEIFGISFIFFFWEVNICSHVFHFYCLGLPF